jgi:phosphoglycolate phosphatase-like HAD superfamily hydrolase
MAAFIFDFDGTIADSRDYVIDFIAKESKKYPLTMAERHKLYGHSMLTVTRELGYPFWKLPGLFIKGRSDMTKSMKRLKPYDGILEILRKIHAEGHQIFIVSSNSLPNIKSFLYRQHAIKDIVAIYGGIEIFGKAPVIKDLMEHYNLSPEDIVCIGDETRDIEAAKSIGLRTIAVTWGFASIHDLKAIEPNWITKTPSELMSILEVI